MHSLSLGRANISFRFTFVRRNFIDQTKRKLSLYHLLKKIELTFKLQRTANSRGGGGTWVFFGWVCAARDSKLAPRSRKKFP